MAALVWKVRHAVSERTMITVLVAMVLTVATILILFAHTWLNPDTVFVGMISILIMPIAAHVGSNTNNRPPSGGAMP